MIFGILLKTNPIVGELLPSLLPSQRTGKRYCDVTGRVKMFYFNLDTVFLSTSNHCSLSLNIQIETFFLL